MLNFSLAFLALFLVSFSYAASPTITPQGTAWNQGNYLQFQSGSTILSSEVNKNFDQLFSQANEFITSGISGTSSLSFTAGGANQNITLTPSGTGFTILNGQVGIGTTTPNTTLQVNGAALIGSSAEGQTNVSLNAGGPASTRALSIYYNSGGTDKSATGDYSVIQSGYGGISNTALTLNPHGGYVGIGITNPSTTLDLGTTVASAAVHLPTVGPSYGGNGDNALLIGNSSDTGGNAEFAVAIPSTSSHWPMISYKAGSLLFGVDVSGTIHAANGTISTSDQREKKNIQDSDLGLDFINQLRPVSYRWKKNLDADLHYGFIAQEVEKVLRKDLKTGKKENIPIVSPIVSYDAKHDQYGIRYTELISPAIKAIQEIYKEFKDLTLQVAQIASDSKAKDRRIQALEAYICTKDPAADLCKKE